jgi:hypothetical protein
VLLAAVILPASMPRLGRAASSAAWESMTAAARRRGREYDVFIRRYVETASRLFPGARHARGIRRGTQA